jgi:Kef-type K+ transport system membrane component KefB
VNELLSVGLILLLALLAGHLVKFARVPEVTGYILAGIALGPSGLHFLSHDNVQALAVFGEVALGLILFSIGSVFELSRFRTTGRQVLLLTLAEACLAALLVAVATLAISGSWTLALLLGVISVETAAASTLMVLRECRSSGPFNDTLVGVVGINNVLCLLGFSLVTAGIDFVAAASAGGALASLYASGFYLVWQLLGSVALGYLVGLVLAAWASKVVAHGEILMLLAGAILLCVGVAQAIDASPLIASLVVGATIANLTRRTQQLFDALSRTDPPLYAIFFVIAGAELDLGLVRTLGALGAGYILARAAGKVAGAALAGRWLELPAGIRHNLGVALLSQAGLAIGLALVIQRRYPEHGPVLGAVVLGAVVVFELVGPVSARFAVLRSARAEA